MELLTPFVMSVGAFDVADSLPYMRKLFADKRGEFAQVVKNGSHYSTLKQYSRLESIDALDNSEESDKIRAQIKLAAIEYATVCGYSADKYEPVVVNFWLNEMGSAGKHSMHSHLGNDFSGCIYVDMPQNTPGIRFYSYKSRFDHLDLDVDNYTVYNAGAWDFSPKEGQMYLWESWIKHEVIPAEYEGVRRSAAFDVVMKHKS